MAQHHLYLHNYYYYFEVATVEGQYLYYYRETATAEVKYLNNYNYYYYRLTVT